MLVLTGILKLGNLNLPLIMKTTSGVMLSTARASEYSSLTTPKAYDKSERAAATRVNLSTRGTLSIKLNSQHHRMVEGKGERGVSGVALQVM